MQTLMPQHAPTSLMNHVRFEKTCNRTDEKQQGKPLLTLVWLLGFQNAFDINFYGAGHIDEWLRLDFWNYPLPDENIFFKVASSHRARFYYTNCILSSWSHGTNIGTTPGRTTKVQQWRGSWITHEQINDKIWLHIHLLMVPTTPCVWLMH